MYQIKDYKQRKKTWKSYNVSHKIINEKKQTKYEYIKIKPTQ